MTPEQPDLFGNPPPPPDPNQPRPGSDAALTAKRKAQLDRGIHPATGLPTLTTGATCGDCAHLWRKRAATFEGYKCQLAARHNTDGPDMRKHWPACTAHTTKDPT